MTLVAAGCGRVGFDPIRGDAYESCGAPANHDEDRDGVDDGCDVCPHLPEDQSDSDGDNVGDACDPRPLLAGDAIAWFDPFVTLDASWVLEGPVALGPDILDVMRNAAIRTRRPVTASNDLFEIAAQIGAGGSGMRQLLLGLGRSVSPDIYYFCELYSLDGGATTELNLVEGDGTGFSNLVSHPLQGRLEQQRVRLQLFDDGVDAGCDSTWAGATRIRATRPAIARSIFVIEAQDLDLQIEYGIQIHVGS